MLFGERIDPYLGQRFGSGATGSISAADTMVIVGYVKSIPRKQKSTYLAKAQNLLAKSCQAQNDGLDSYYLRALHVGGLGAYFTKIDCRLICIQGMLSKFLLFYDISGEITGYTMVSYVYILWVYATHMSEIHPLCTNPQSPESSLVRLR